MDGQRLQPELRRAADHGRGARRPLRAPQPLRRRPGAVRRGVGGLRAGARCRLADRGARGPGRRRRAADAARPGAPERRLPARERGAAIGIFSAITGLPVASGPLVGGAVVEGLAGSGSSGSTSRSGWSRPARADADEGELRARHRARHPAAWCSSPAARSGSSGGWCAATRPAGAAPRSSARSPSGALLVAAFVAWELRAREPMLPMRFFRSRAFSAGNTAIFFTFASLFGAVFFFAAAAADGARLRPARHRAAAAALDRHVHDGRPDRRRAGRPDRRAAADGRRAVAPGGRDGLGRADRRARRGVLGAARAVHRRRRRRLDGDPGRAELGRRLGGDRRRSARRPAPTA